MKQTLNYSGFKFASLLFAFVATFISCDGNDDLSDIDRVSMKTLPQVKYVVGDALNLSDMIITLEKGGSIQDIPYSSFETEHIITNPEDGKILELSDFSMTVKVGDSGSGLIQTIEVTNDVIAVAIKTEPTKDYVVGERLDLTNLVVTLSYENGDQKEVPYSEFGAEIITMPEHGEPLELDDSEVLITHVESEINSTQDINMSAFLPRTGVLKTPPLKTEYAVGEILDLTGTVITFTMFDGTTEVDVVAEDFELFNLSVSPAHGSILEAGDTEVKVSRLFARVSIPLIIN